MKKFILKEEQLKRVIKKLNEDNISELRDFEQRIYDVVMDFIDEINNHDEENYLIINKETLATSVGLKGDDNKNDYYLINDYIRVDDDEDGELIPNVDAISELASGYIFVR